MSGIKSKKETEQRSEEEKESSRTGWMIILAMAALSLIRRRRGVKRLEAGQEATEERPPEEEKTGGREWMIILAMAIFFFLWGIFAYFVIGEKGPHPWDFGVVEDIPGGSAYSTYQPDRISGSYPSEEQHVSGRTPGANLIKGE